MSDAKWLLCIDSENVKNTDTIKTLFGKQDFAIEIQVTDRKALMTTAISHLEYNRTWARETKVHADRYC